MNLFNYKNKVIKNRKICNNFFQDKIITDLGEILVECFFYKNNFQFDIKYFNNFTHFSLVNPYLTIECLNTEIIENNEDLLDYGIENTKLWIFRIISKEINQDVKLKISFIEKVSCEIESGGDQGYVYKSFSNNGKSILIGTESLDFLELRAEENYYLSKSLYQELYNKEIMEREFKNGFLFDLKNIETNIINQFQFVASFSNHIPDLGLYTDSICQNSKYILNNLSIL